MIHFLAVVLFLASVCTSRAHLGNENSADIHVYPDSMRIVLRTSIPLAWRFLGEDAPLRADAAGQSIARPLLIAAAPGLLTVSAAGLPLAPTAVDCRFEVEDDVAFIYHFKRPTEWPVVVKAEYFERLGPLETGTIAAYDSTASRFAREVEPLAQKTMDRSNPSLSFTLVEPSVSNKRDGEAPPPPASSPPSGGRGITGIWFLLAGVATLIILLFRRISAR